MKQKKRSGSLVLPSKDEVTKNVYYNFVALMIVIGGWVINCSSLKIFLKHYILPIGWEKCRRKSQPHSSS